MRNKSYQRVSQVAQIHRDNMLKTLEHRLEVARARGEKQLIVQLEAEKDYYSN